MADTNAIEEENVAMRQALERVAFLVVGASCTNKRCMHEACSVVRTIEGNLTEFMKKKRPDEVVGYQERIQELNLRLKTIRETSSLP